MGSGAMGAVVGARVRFGDAALLPTDLPVPYFFASDCLDADLAGLADDVLVDR